MTAEQIQCLLGALGFYGLRRRDGSLAVDGIPGKATRGAVLGFQRAYGHRFGRIREDGIWGPETEKAVRKIIGADVALDREPQEDLERRIWDFLLGKGISPEGAAGILGNLRAESDLKPRNLEDIYQRKLGYSDESYTEAVDSGAYGGFAVDCAGYGLAQWTWHSRKRELLALAGSRGASVGDPGVQLDFLWQELERDFPALLKALRGRMTLDEAAARFMRSYEQPADQSAAAAGIRAALGRNSYERMRKRGN